MGMPEAVIAQVDRSGRTSGTVTVRAPIGGVVQTLGARAGVTLAEGQTLAEISGLGTVWLNAALPEAQSGAVQVGQRATAKLTAFPGEAFGGRVVAILPTAAADSRTLTVRVELANRGGRLAGIGGADDDLDVGKIGEGVDRRGADGSDPDQRQDQRRRDDQPARGHRCANDPFDHFASSSGRTAMPVRLASESRRN